MHEKFKHESMTTEKMALASIQNAHAIKQYRYNNFAYEVLMATHNVKYSFSVFLNALRVLP
jgi:hypothetical protein